jgi:broad specificity phosphatase PhoE
MSIYLIRHGESEGNLGRIYQGQLDLPLTDKGRAQARVIGGWLQGLGVKPAAIYASPLRRAWETAELIASQFPELGFELRQEPGVIEYAAGELQGLTDSEIRERYPSFMDRRLSERGCLKEFGGESYEEVQARLQAFIDRVSTEHRDHDIIVVAHGGSLYQLLKLWCGYPAPRHYFTHISNCTTFKLNLRNIGEHAGAELQFMVPLELVEQGLGRTGRLDLPEA